MRRSVPRLLATISLSWLLAIPAFADLTGDVQGTVTDASGARVADAKITIKDLGNGATRTFTTGAAGEFSFPQLEIGEFLVTVEKTGFKTFDQHVMVRSGEKTRIDAVMQLGNVSESVVVESSATPTLDVASAQVSDSISEQVALALPNQARDPVIYATLSPGTVPVTKDNPFLGVGSFDSNGSRGRANNITLDGVTATDISTTGEGGGLVLSQDAVQEVKVITNNFDAEFGRNSGSQVQILTKSGTNNFHGSGFWYFQNNDLGNARDFFDQTGQPTPIIQNQGGGTFGGPIYKDHTFFYGSGEVDRTRGAGATATATVLTTAQAAGITNPTTLALFKADGSPSSASGQISNSAPNELNGDLWTLRIDQLLRGGKDTISVKYGQNPVQAITPGDTFVGTNLAGLGASVTSTARTLTFSYTSVLRTSDEPVPFFAFGRSNPDFPISSPFPPGPQIQISGFDNFGTSDILPQGRTQNTFQYLDTVSWVKGRHTFKVGADINRYQSPSTSDFFTRGQISFASVTAFQDGNPSGYFQQVGNFTRHNFALDAFMFVQDDFRPTDTLTLNLGFRLESSGGVSEGANLISNVDPNNHTPIGVLEPGRWAELTSAEMPSTAIGIPRPGSASRGILVTANWSSAVDTASRTISSTRTRFPMCSFPLPLSTAYPSPADTSPVATRWQPWWQEPLQHSSRPSRLSDPLIRRKPTLVPCLQWTRIEESAKSAWDAGMEYQATKDLVLKATYVGAHSDHLQVSVPVNLVAPQNRPAPPPAWRIRMRVKRNSRRVQQ